MGRAEPVHHGYRIYGQKIDILCSITYALKINSFRDFALSEIMYKTEERNSRL